ncbi:hypothetical protein BDZ89DRAFT_954226, partial [Hymenopellis radicata]
SNAAFSPSYTPVAVFVGGTSGVGEAMAKALASYLGGSLHLVIVGRNRDAAEKTFASLPRPEGVLREFVSCDAYLMRNITVSCLLSSKTKYRQNAYRSGHEPLH